VTKRKKHSHEWTALYSAFGPYRHAGKHAHQCITCDAILIGEGAHCSGRNAPHAVEEIEAELVEAKP
jgi:hypothetical protein